MLLPVLIAIDHHPAVNVFELWPPYQPCVQGGDTKYWHSLPHHLLLAIVNDKLPIWPIVGEIGHSAELGSVLVASGTEKADALLALAKAGVSIANPPAYVRDLLAHAGVEYTPLNPATSREVLLVRVSLVLVIPSDLDHSRKMSQALIN